jgi:hypothetical protein
VSGAGGDGAGAYISRDELERLVDDLTVEDVRLAQAEYPEGDPMRGFASVYHAAKRTGVTTGDVSAFLSRVRLRDLAPLLDEGARAGKVSDGSASPISADTGA